MRVWKTVWTVTTCDTGDGMEPTIDVCETLETAKQLAIEILDLDGWNEDDSEDTDLMGDDSVIQILSRSVEAVKKFDGGGGFLEVPYFDGNMGVLRIQSAVLR